MFIMPRTQSQVSLQRSPEEDSHILEFTPDEVGDYSVDLRLGETPLLTAPLGVKVYDDSRVKVRRRPHLSL